MINDILELPAADPTPAVDVVANQSAVLRGLECVLIFGMVPLLHFIGVLRLPVIPVAVGAAVAAFLVLRTHRDFDRRRLWNTRHLGPRLREVFALFALGGALIAACVFLWLPDRLLDLPRQHPVTWLALMIVYPLLSVYPQEVIFRAFFFHRYRPVFGNGWLMILVSALMFAYAHIIFRNWIAVAMCLVGGVVFGWRYRRTGSLLVTSTEHALYGCLIFTIGLAAYFMGASLGGVVVQR